jgi:hypothetical protein
VNSRKHREEQRSLKMLTGSDMRWARKLHSLPSWADNAAGVVESLNHRCHRSEKG